VLFACSITPKKTLHDIFGCHPERVNNIKVNGKQQIATNGFHCSCQQPDLQAPFLQEQVLNELTLPEVFYAGVTIFFTTDLFERAVSFSKLRGPPSLA
jgi:hypothetical protein